MTETPPTDHRPGVGDIGPTERQRRYRYADVCGVSTVAVPAPRLPSALLLGLFVPRSFGTELFLQTRRPFRANGGSRGRSEFGEDGSVGGGGSVGGVDGPLAPDDGGGRATDPEHAAPTDGTRSG